MNYGFYIKEGQLTFKTRKEREYEIDVVARIFFDKNYGADIDGNRGIYQEEIDDIRITCIRNNKRIIPTDYYSWLSEDYRNRIMDFVWNNIYKI